MSQEALRIQPPAQEQVQQAPETVEAAFEAANRAFYGITRDTGLHTELFVAGLHPYEDCEKPAYWSIVADFSRRRVQAIRNDPEKGDSLRLGAFELLATAPDFLFAQHTLDLYEATNPEGRRDINKFKPEREAVSDYNDLLIDFALAHPQATQSEVGRGILGIVNRTFADNPAVRQASAQIVKRHLHGTGHEDAFGQILAHTGRRFRRATRREDLDDMDYVVEDSQGNYMGVNVKASELSLRGKRGNNGYYAYTHGKLYMISLANDMDFHGGFFISDELAQQQAPLLNALLTQVENQKTIAVHY